MTCPADANIEQTLFLGCSIQNFRCTLGWNEQPSTLTVNIVEDTCNTGERVYYDLNSANPRKTRVGADPGFEIYGEDGSSAPEIGAPCYFRYGDFEFCGLIQNWQKIQVGSDTNVYTVTLASPTELLQGTSLILGQYAGEVKGFNIFNIYGFQEYLNGKSCTTFTQFEADGPLFGSIAQGFGGADLTEAGMPWTKVRDALQLLTSNITVFPNEAINNFSEYNRIAYVGAPRDGYGLLPSDSINIPAGSLFGYAKYISEYVLDISDIPVANTDYRISGPTADILTVISQVCQDLAHDYYVELVPVRFNGQILKVIKFRTVSRVEQKPTDIVQTYVESLSTAELIDSSYGRELRNEATTNFVIGGQKRSMYQVYNGIPFSEADPDSNYFDANYPGNAYVRDTIVPYYGQDYFGNIYVVKNDNTIDINLIGIKNSLNTIGALLPDTINVSVRSLIEATLGFDMWLTHLQWNQSTEPLFETLKSAAPKSYKSFFGRAIDLPDPGRQKAQLRDIVETASVRNAFDDATKDLYKLHEFFAGIGQRGRSQAMVRIPYTCATIENGRVVTTDRPSDGGWTEHTNVLGLDNPGGAVDFFKNEDGTIHSLAAYSYNSGLNVDGIGGKYFFTDLSEDEMLPSGILYTEIQAEEELVFLDANNAVSPRIIVNLPDLNDVITPVDDALSQKAATASINLAFNTSPASGVEKEIARFSNIDTLIEPDSVAVGFVSRENTYGPWKPSNIIEAGPPGRVNIEKDETLVPWTYGSYVNMNTVAQARANDSVGGMNVVENGSIVVDGYPNVPLGSELASLQGLNNKFYQSLENLYENRSADLTTINATINGSNLVFDVPFIAYGIWNGTFGPNVTGIDVQVGTEGIRTTYNFRTYSPKFGTLSKYNANQLSDRLKRLNKIQSQQRLQTTIDNIQNANVKRLKSLGGVSTSDSSSKDDKKKGSAAQFTQDQEKMNPPSALLVGELADFSVTGLPSETDSSVAPTAKRSLVASKSIMSASNELINNGYDNKAIMSMDGLFRPVSLSGDGGLPRMAQALSQETYNTTSGEDNTITNKYLVFLSNPTGYAFSDLASLNASNASTGLGHDIEIVARNTYNDFTGTGNGNSLSLVMHSNVKNNKLCSDYSNDYRFFALRGPLWMHGWGYDLDGKPVPNEIDTTGNARSGIFTPSGSNKFLDGWLRQPDTWPSAPIDLRFDHQRGVWTVPASGGGGGGDGTAGQVVLLVDNLNGYVWDDDMTVSPGTVRCLPVSYSNGTMSVNDQDDFVNLIPREGVSLLLNDADCCDTTTAGSPGLTIDSPVFGGLSNLFTVNNPAATVRGGGVDSRSTVAVTITDGSTVRNPVVTVSDSGRWESEPQTFVSVFNAGVIKITAVETDINGIAQAPVSIAVIWNDDASSGGSVADGGASNPGQPIKVDMTEDSDTGISTDNITSGTTPSFVITSPVPGSVLGPQPALIIDGEVVTTDEVFNANNFDAVANPTTTGTPSTALTNGYHTIQTYLTNLDTDDIPGGTSDHLTILIDPEEGGEDSIVRRYGRTGLRLDISPTFSVLDDIGKCPILLSKHLTDRANEEITARATIDTDFISTDADISFDTNTITIQNPTTGIDPASPTSPISNVSLSGNIDDTLRMLWDGSSWISRDIKFN